MGAQSDWQCTTPTQGAAALAVGQGSKLAELWSCVEAQRDGVNLLEATKPASVGWEALVT